MNTEKKTVSEIIDLKLKTGANSGPADPFHEIIGAIDDVVVQTNLLALGAATQVSRGGGQATNMAGVVDAVRHMAERANRATEELNALVDEVQSEASLHAAEGKSQLLAQRASLALSDVMQSSEAVLEKLQQVASMTDREVESPNSLSRG